MALERPMGAESSDPSVRADGAATGLVASPAKLIRSGRAGGAKGCSTMGWERCGDRTYYYRKVRIGRRVVCVYLGDGEIAELSAALDAERRQARARRRAELQAERRSLRETDSAVVAMFDHVEGLAREALRAAG